MLVVVGALVLGAVPTLSVAQSECSAETQKSLAAFTQWQNHLEKQLGSVSALTAMQDLRTEADRLSRALEGLDVMNRLQRRFSAIIRDIVLTQGAAPGSHTSREIGYQISWADQSLSDLSYCLAFVPVNVRNINSITLVGAATAVSIVDPKLFDSIGVIDSALRNDAPLSHEDGQALFGSLRHVNQPFERTGTFSTCAQRYETARTSGYRFRVPGAQMGQDDWVFFTIEPSVAARTLMELKDMCGP